MKLADIQKGTGVTRMVAGQIPQELVVTDASDTQINCGPWTFLRETGGEVDEDLGWDGRNTGSYLLADDSPFCLSSAPQQPQPVKYSGWIFTDARLVVCPKCAAQPNEYCRTPGGRKATHPHGERIVKLKEEHPGAFAAATRPAKSSTLEILANAHNMAQERREDGWTKSDFANGLKAMLESPTGEDTYRPPTAKPELRIAHVGDIGSSRDTSMRIIATDWLSRKGKGLLKGRKVKHDFIDLSGGRDFLRESQRYDVVILHFLWAGETLTHSDALKRMTITSPDHSPQKWRERLAATGATVILAFGGSSEVARVFIGNIDGYDVTEVLEPAPFQFGVWRKRENRGTDAQVPRQVLPGDNRR